MHIAGGSRATAIYRAERVVERFYCRFGLNPAYRGAIEGAGLVVSGTGDDGEARVVEIRSHTFFLATLFVPQARSAPGAPHPMLQAFAEAAARRG